MTPILILLSLLSVCYSYKFRPLIRLHAKRTFALFTIPKDILSLFVCAESIESASPLQIEILKAIASVSVYAVLATYFGISIKDSTDKKIAADKESTDKKIADTEKQIVADKESTEKRIATDKESTEKQIAADKESTAQQIIANKALNDLAVLKIEALIMRLLNDSKAT